MPTTANVAAFVAASMLLLLIPGPSAFFVMGRALAGGRRVGMLSVAGNALGILPGVALVSLGVGSLVARSVPVLVGLKICGAVFIMHLGVQTWRHRHRVELAPRGDDHASSLRLVRAGVWVGVTNPKAMVVLVAILPQFVDPSAGPVWSQLLVLGLLSNVLGTLVDGSWVLAAGGLRARLTTTTALRRVKGAGGLLMLALGGGLLASTRGAA